MCIEKILLALKISLVAVALQEYHFRDIPKEVKLLMDGCNFISMISFAI